MATGNEPIYSTFHDDPDLADLIGEFVNALPQRVNAIVSAMENNDLDTLRRLAHQLKGASGGYGFQVIGTAAASLEASARTAASAGELTRQVQELVALCRRARHHQNACQNLMNPGPS